jgi:hypothetical protein
MSLPFALLIPGFPLVTAFDELNGIFHIDVPAPKTIANVTFFLTQPIPDNYALALYFSAPPYTAMQYLGAIANEKPSDSFATGFPLKPELDGCESLKFCVQAQSFEEISGLVRCEDGQKEYAKLVAHNLYNFMMSYHKEGMLVNNPEGKEYLVIPSEVFTRWVKKFDEKYARDPNFILKTTLE